jgi:hypothetical protein
MGRMARSRFGAAHCRLALVLALLGGCSANGDFGRVRPSLVHDDVHAWMGPEAVNRVGEPASSYDLTDDERLLRDLAYPLIEPPYARQRWFSVLNEYGLTQASRHDWVVWDRTVYAAKLMGSAYRSATARYAQLTEDVRNDITRVGPFLRTATRVADMDGKREKSLAYVSELSELEALNAIARIRENALIVAWVCRSLHARIDSYQFALERLVIATPGQPALEGERTLTQLKARVGACLAPPAQHLPAPLRGPRSGHVSKG